jgi:hypothetical protein
MQRELEPMSIGRYLAFTIKDVTRLLRNYADRKSPQFGMSRPKWVVLARLRSSSGSAETARSIRLIGELAITKQR